MSHQGWKHEWGPRPTHIKNKSFNLGKRQGFAAGFSVGVCLCTLLAAIVLANLG